MNLNPLSLGFYAPVNQMLISATHRDILALAEKWQDEAAEAAIAGNPARAGYIEHMVGRLG